MGDMHAPFKEDSGDIKKKGIGSIEDKQFKTTRDMDKIYDDFITVGNSRITGEKELLEWALSASSASIGSADMKSLKKQVL